MCGVGAVPNPVRRLSGRGVGLCRRGSMRICESTTAEPSSSDRSMLHHPNLLLPPLHGGGSKLDACLLCSGGPSNSQARSPRLSSLGHRTPSRRASRSPQPAIRLRGWHDLVQSSGRSDSSCDPASDSRPDSSCDPRSDSSCERASGRVSGSRAAGSGAAGSGAAGGRASRPYRGLADLTTKQGLSCRLDPFLVDMGLIWTGS